MNFPNIQIKVDTAPLFQLCGSSEDQKEQYFLFPNVFDFWFYKSWCYNMGGSVAVADTDEMYHGQMDIAESLVDPQTHEKVRQSFTIITLTENKCSSVCTPAGR